MKNLLHTLIVALGTTVAVYAQDSKLPYVSIKTNLLYDATTTLNVALEVALGKQTTIDIAASYNPWVFNDGRKFKIWFVQPEFRYYLGSRFEGHFFGIHPHYGQYNVHGLGLFGTQSSTKQGDFYGAGVSYGYQWRIANRWNIEASLGVGFARLKYNLYDCNQCGRNVATIYQTYLGPTKVAVSIIYIIK